MARTALREACYAALAACLRAGLPDVPLERNRRALISPAETFPQLVLLDGSQVPVDPPAIGEDAWDMGARLEGFVSSPDADTGPEVSDLYARAAEALLAAPLSLAGTIQGIPVEIYVTEGALDFDAASVAESGKPIAAFYLDLAFQLRVPVGARFIDTP